MMDEQQTTDETQALALQHNTVLAKVKAIPKIKDTEQYRQVCAWRALFGSGMDYFHKQYDERIADANKIHKDLIKDRDKLLAPSKEGWNIAGNLVARYDSDQEEIKKRKQREEEDAKEAEKQRLVDLAKKMEIPELVEEIQAQPVEPTVVVKETPPAKETGVSFREDKKWRLKDDNLVPDDYWMLDEAKIGKIVRAGVQIPGIEVYVVKIPIQRT